MTTTAARAVDVVEELEVRRFQCVCAFLHDNPERFSWRGNRPDLTTRAGLTDIARKFFAVRQRRDYPAPPTTVPDEAVSIVMQVVYRYTAVEAERIKVEHQHSMSAENIVGALLERYISLVMEPHGWVWCAGDFVKAVDFIRYAPPNGWQAVQVKNRDNTENSSSKAIRNGTDIEKWFRSFSRKERYNWAAFPEVEFRRLLSEDGFRQFLRNYLAQPR